MSDTTEIESKGIEDLVILQFLDSPSGRVAWYSWKKMTDDQKRATGLLGPISAGSRIFILPGVVAIIALKDGRVLTINAWRSTFLQDLYSRVKLWWLKRQQKNYHKEDQ